eukprot:c23854_g2_i1 orf=2-1798(+)
MDDKDAEALRCQKALVEEEEAAQKKRAKVLERKRQRKLRQKEFKDNKERKSMESASCLEELKFDPFPLEGEDSLTATQSSPSSSGYSGLDLHSLETPHMADGDFEDANNSKSPTNGLEDGPSCGDPDDLDGTRSGCFNYEGSQKLASQGDSLEERGAKASNGPVVGSGAGWKDRRPGDFSHFPNHGRQPYIKDRRHYDYQYGGQRLTRTPSEYSTPRYTQYREKSTLKRPTAVAGMGHAVWTRKTPQNPAAVSQHNEYGEVTGGEVGDDSTGTGSVRQFEHLDNGDKSCSANSRRPKGLTRGSSLSSDSITSQSSGSISARVGAEEQEDTGDTTVPVTFPPQIASDFAGSGALVIGSVTIPLGDPLPSSVVNAESARDSNEKDLSEVDCEVKSTVPEKSGSSPATCESAEGPELLRTTSQDAQREASVTPRGITSHQSGGREDSTAQSKSLGSSAQNKPVVVKVWRPVTPGERSSPRTTCPALAEGERSDAADTPAQLWGETGANFRSLSPIQPQHLVSGSEHQDPETMDPDSVFEVTATCLSEAAGQQLADYHLTSYYSEIASFLSQRWQKAISSSDIACYDELDDVDGVPSGYSVV